LSPGAPSLISDAGPGQGAPASTPDPLVALVGPPNSGKSTLFNELTGLRQRVANYPGVTVERRSGVVLEPTGPVEVIDLPGVHGLSPRSLDQ
jgi:ferrous iron transport protein B